MNYFYVSGKNNSSFGVAYTCDEKEVDLSKPEEIRNWQTLSFKMEKGVMADLLPNNITLKLCSKKLKDIIEKYKSVNDKIQWLPVCVDKAGQKEDYYILHLYEYLDVLNKENTIFGAYNSVIKPVISKTSVGDHMIFTFRGRESTFFISEDVKKHIEKEKCVGIEFDKVSATE